MTAIFQKLEKVSALNFHALETEVSMGLGMQLKVYGEVPLCTNLLQ